MSKHHKNPSSKLEIIEEVVQGVLDTTGYAVRYKNGKEIGVVQDVIDMGYQHQLLVSEELKITLQRSRKAEQAGQVGHTQSTSLSATHHIPLVPDLVQKIDATRQLITLQLPRGLLQLGRQDAYCRLLAEEIPQYTEQLTNRFRDRMLGEREFPSLQKLRDAGRSDLVQLIKKAGGLATVASCIGLRSPRKPQGYFEDLQVLDWELSCFIAAGWVHMPPLMEPLLTTAHLQAAADTTGDAEAAQASFQVAEDDDDFTESGYFFNTVTDEASVDEPEIPQLVESEDGIEIVEDEQQRFMPLQSSLHAAGRHDLATAVKQHGGFRAVAEALDRKLLYQWSPTDTDMRRLEAAVRECQASVGLRADEMPSRSHLEQAGMPHVVRWVVVAGGFSKVAEQLNMTSRRARKHVTPEQLAPALEEFCDKHMHPERQHLVPSLRELRTAGRHDLARRFRRCTDKRRVSELLQRELPTRGPLPGKRKTPQSPKKSLSREGDVNPPQPVQLEGRRKALAGSSRGKGDAETVATGDAGSRPRASRAATGFWAAVGAGMDARASSNHMLELGVEL